MRYRAMGLVLAAVVGLAAEVPAQGESPRDVALELARLTIDDATRRRIDEQVAAGILQSLGATLQQRLNRRLLEVEWRILSGIVERFLRETLPPGRPEALAAQIYTEHFEDAELRELLTFQRSPLGRKAARLSPVIASATLRAIDREIRTSAAAPEMLAELQRAFPILGGTESP